MKEFDLDDVWCTILFANPPPSKQRVAAALLPLFREYVNFDQQESSLTREHYSLLQNLEKLAQSSQVADESPKIPEN